MFAEDLTEPTFRCVTFLEPEQSAHVDEGIDATGLEVVTVDGTAMLTHADQLAVVGRAFSFPDYYGQNYNALHECLRDLDWLPAPGYVLRVREAEAQWRQAPKVAAALAEAWLFCAEYWASLEDPVPFHLLYQW